MVNETYNITVDAFSHGISIRNGDITRESKKECLYSILEDFTIEQFKSIFFLLTDYIDKENDFFSITKLEKPKLKEKFWEIVENHSDELIIELLGTMKLYKYLKAFDSCSHIFKNCQGTKFNKIDNIWKMLFSLCEELTDEEVLRLKDFSPSSIRHQIVSAEDYFFSAFKQNIFSKKDVSKLQEILIRYPVCSKVIQDFNDSLSGYTIKTPTATSNCGIALIFNYEEFDEKFNLPKRKGSDIDVNSLKNLWNEFGFETRIFTNLTCEETFNELKKCASLDHTDYDVFVCCFLSHGVSDSVISFDGVKMPISTLQAKVINHSKSLVSKPKLFFVQACQGDYVQDCGKPIRCFNSATSTLKECTNGMEMPPLKSDVLLVVASIRGYVSFRDPENGTFFISSLCKVMKTLGDKKSILDVMLEVINEVGKKKGYLGHGFPIATGQIVENSSTLDKYLILKKRSDQ